MKTTITSICFLLSLSLSLSAQTYEFSVATETYENLSNSTSLNEGEISDDPGYSLPIGFDLSIGDKTFTTINFLDDGLGGVLSLSSNLDEYLSV